MKNAFKQNKSEIIYNLINSALAGGLVVLGSLSTGEITVQGIFYGCIAGGIVLLTKFKEYWDGEKKEYLNKIFTFY